MHKITFLIALAAAGVVSAAERRVPAQYSTIQAAIDAAASGDVVVVGPGTYRETVDLREKELVLRSEGGAGATILDGSGGATSILTARHVAPRSVVVQGFTFRNGPGSLVPSCGLGDVRKGGAILVSRARLAIVDCVFEDNGADGIDYGGAIFSCETELSVQRSEFTRNRANHGAIVIASVSTRASSITDSRFTDNTGDTDTAGVLAKLRSNASLIVRDCDFEDNEGGHGTAMMFELLEGSRAEVERVRFSRNHARGTAGGLDVLASDEATIAISNCTFDANRAAHGAGLELVTERSAIASVDGCTFSGGSASFGGGANVVTAGAAARIDITECAFTGNQGAFGGGLIAAALDGAIRVSGSRFLDNVAQFRPETGIYRRRHLPLHMDNQLPSLSDPHNGAGYRLPGQNASTPCGRHTQGVAVDISTRAWDQYGNSTGAHDCTVWNVLASCAHAAGGWVEPWADIQASGVIHMHISFGQAANTPQEYGDACANP